MAAVYRIQISTGESCNKTGSTIETGMFVSDDITCNDKA